MPAEYPIELITVTHTVVDSTVAEVLNIYTATKGERIIAADAQKLTLADASTDSTFILGDATDDDGFITAIDTESGSANDWVDQQGAYLATSGGKLYNTPTVIISTYAPGTTPGTIEPSVKYRVWVAKK